MTTPTTTTAPRQTLAELLEDAGMRDFVNTWSEEAVYQVADGYTRKEAIVLLAADLRRMQEEEVPEFTPVLRALEAAAGPQRVIALETVGAPARGEVLANQVVAEVLGAASGARDLLCAQSFTEEQCLTRLGGLFEQLATICSAAAKGEHCCERAPAQEDLDRDIRSARAQRLLLTPCMDALEAHRLEVEREVLARHRRSVQQRQPPNQKQRYFEAKRATRQYFTRAAAQRLGVQLDFDL